MAAAAPPVTPRQKQPKQPNANQAFMAQYNRANGNMSVQRRMIVIVPALIRSGYSQKDAEEIALDAPLSKDYTNERAYYETLKYAASIAPGGTQTAAGAALAPALVPMPAQASRQLQDLQNQNRPLGGVRTGSQGFLGSVWKGLNAIGEKLSPTATRVGDQPTPGGIGTLFALNLLFLAAIVPANAQGYTRLELIWLTLMNRTHLDSEIPPPAVPNNALIEAAIGTAEGIQEAAQAIGNVAGSIAGVTGGVGDFFNSVPIIGPIISAVTGIGGGPDVPPPTNTGMNAPMITARAPSQPKRVGT